MTFPTRRLVIVVRADPVICGHSGEARNLAEVALTRGYDDVRLLTWPIPTLQAAGLPLKPLDRVADQTYVVGSAAVTTCEYSETAWSVLELSVRMSVKPAGGVMVLGVV